MTKRIAALTLAGALCATAQTARPDWFPKKDMMTIGVYYYPEAWPESQWSRDMANMKKMGMEFVHMGEFAWAFMEPQEGRMELDWLERNVELAAQNGLKVILCTPSATPPVWLTRKHPEILMVDANGRRVNHGGRQQGDWSSPVYRDYVKKIVTALAMKFGQDKRVWGWQLDNELSHYEKQYSYSPAATASSRQVSHGAQSTGSSCETAAPPSTLNAATRVRARDTHTSVEYCLASAL
jgi:beta-galactosidase